jgi:hypothetical protein
MCLSDRVYVPYLSMDTPFLRETYALKCVSNQIKPPGVCYINRGKGLSIGHVIRCDSHVLWVMMEIGGSQNSIKIAQGT